MPQGNHARRGEMRGGLHVSFFLHFKLAALRWCRFESAGLRQGVVR
jgi:hypothetical protein